MTPHVVPIANVLVLAGRFSQSYPPLYTAPSSYVILFMSRPHINSVDDTTGSIIMYSTAEYPLLLKPFTSTPLSISRHTRTTVTEEDNNFLFVETE